MNVSIRPIQNNVTLRLQVNDGSNDGLLISIFCKCIKEKQVFIFINRSKTEIENWITGASDWVRTKWIYRMRELHRPHILVCPLKLKGIKLTFLHKLNSENPAATNFNSRSPEKARRTHCFQLILHAISPPPPTTLFVILEKTSIVLTNLKRHLNAH